MKDESVKDPPAQPVLGAVPGDLHILSRFPAQSIRTPSPADTENTASTV